MRLTRVALIIALLPLIVGATRGTRIGPQERLFAGGGLPPIWVIGETHFGTAGDPQAGTLGRQVRRNGVGAVIAGGDLTVLMGLSDGGDAAVGCWKTFVKDSLGGIGVWGVPNNHDFATDVFGADLGLYDTGFTAADSADPLWRIREVLPYMDQYGNSAVTIGNCKFILLQNWFNALGDTCKVGTNKAKWAHPLWGQGVASIATYSSYWPTSNYPNWATKGSPVWQWVYWQIKTCDVPFLFIIMGNGLYEVQGFGNAGRVAWGQHQATTTEGDTTTFGDMTEITTTALGYHVTARWSWHAHHSTVLSPSRNDSVIAYASGGVYDFIGPHASTTHCGAPAAWDSATAATAPDTCNRAEFSSWSTHHWTSGARLLFHERQSTADGRLNPCHAEIRPYGWNSVEVVFADSADAPYWRSGPLAPR